MPTSLACWNVSRPCCAKNKALLCRDRMGSWQKEGAQKQQSVLLHKCESN